MLIIKIAYVQNRVLILHDINGVVMPMKTIFSPLPLGTKIKQIRVNKKINQNALAVAADTTSMTISRIERGVMECSLDILMAIKECIGIENAPLLEHELIVYRNRIWVWNDLITANRETEAMIMQNELSPILDLHFEHDLLSLYHMTEVRLLLKLKNFATAEKIMNNINPTDTSTEVLHLYHRNLGSLYDASGDNQNAIKHYLKTLELVCEDIKPDAAIYLNIGIDYFNLGKILYAIKYLETAQREFNGDRSNGLGPSVNNWLARCYITLSEYHKANDLLNKSLAKAQSCNDEHVTCAVLINMGLLNDKTGDFKRSLDYYDQALSYSSNKNHHLTALINKASLLVKMKKHEKCREVLEEVKVHANGNKTYTILFNMISHQMTLYDNDSVKYIEDVAIPYLRSSEGTIKFMALAQCRMLEAHYKKKRSYAKALANAAIARDIYEEMFLGDAV